MFALVSILSVVVSAFADRLLDAAFYHKLTQGDSEALLQAKQALVPNEITPEVAVQLARALEKAAQKSALAQKLLGDAYSQGIGVDKDLKKAFDYYSKAAIRQEPEAQIALSKAYYKGLGTDPNTISAYIWASIGETNLSGLEKKEAIDLKEQIGSKLAPSQLEKAQTLTLQIKELYI